MSIIAPFDFHGHQVRVITAEDGEPRWVAADVAKVLGYRDSEKMVRNLRDRHRGTHTVGTPSGDQTMTVITEAGLYAAVLKSRRPDAEEFQDWVTDEVLPAIRRTGSYGAPALTEEEVVQKALQITYRQVQELQAKVSADEHKVSYHDDFVCTEDLLRFSTVASTIGITEKFLRELLIEHGWIYKEESTRRSSKTGEKKTVYRYSEYADKKPYFQRQEVHDAPRFRGEVMHTLKITPDGAMSVARAVRCWLSQLDQDSVAVA